MLLHYIKTTVRDIAKNKFQYLLTTLGIAGGITVFAVLNFISDITNHYLVDLPNEKNLYKLEAVQEKISESGPDGSVFPSWMTPVSLEDLTKLKELQMPEIETMTLYSGLSVRNYFCSPENDERTVFEVYLRHVDANYFSLTGAEFLKGSTEAWGNSRLAVITETLAKKLFGSASNAMRQNIELRGQDNRSYGIFTVTGVINPIYAFNYQADVFLENEINEFTSSYSALARLAPGTSFQQTNISIETASKSFDIKPYSEREGGGKVFFRLAGLKENMGVVPPLVQAIILFLAATALIIALFNFFNLLVSSAQARVRQFTLRKVVGAKRWALSLMFFCEIIPVILGATLLSYVFIELLMNWSVTPNLDPDLWRTIQTFIHLIYGYPLRVALYTLLACIVVIILLTYRVEKIVLVQGIRGKLLKSNRGYARKGLIFFQLLFTLLLFSVSVELFRFGTNAIPNVHHTLSKEQEKAVFFMEFMGKLGMEEKKDEIIARVKQVSGVEAVVFTEPFFDNSRAIETLSNGKPIYFTNKKMFDGYAEFLELKELLPVAALSPDEVIVNEALAKVLAENGETGVSLYGQNYKIVGVVPRIPYAEENELSALFPSSVTPFSSYAVKCNPGQAKVVKTEIMSIVREYLPETIPFPLHNLYDLMRRESIQLIGIIGALAMGTLMSLVITLFGIYAAVSGDTRHRRKEIAIRKINGATYRNILWEYLKQYAVMLAIILVLLVPLYMFTVKAVTKELASIGILFITWLTLVPFVLLTIYDLVKKAANENPAKVLKSE